MKIKVLNNVWSLATEEVDVLRESLKYPCERWTRRGNKKERHVYFLTMVGNTGYFFTGLIPFIKENFPDAEISHIPTQATFHKIPDKLGPFIFETHQRDIIRTCLQKRRGIVQAPTAAGKTVVAAGIIAALNKRSLFLVRSKDLMYQTKEVFETILPLSVGIVGEGKVEPATVTVGMIQTLCKWDSERLRNEFPVLSIIVDEAHHAQAETYIQTIRSIDCPYRIGLTATPKEKREDLGGYLKVTGVLGPVIHKTSIHEVPTRIAQPLLKMLTYEADSQAYKNLDWPDCYDHGVVDNLTRNQKIMGAARAYARRGKSVLIVVKRIEHGEKLQELLGGVVFVQGSDDAKTRREVKSLLQNRGHIAIATNIFSEGVDMPRLDVLINAAGGLSKIAIIQQAGRVLRRTKEKEFGTIVDFWDNENYFLKRHSRQRYIMYKEVLQALEV